MRLMILLAVSCAPVPQLSERSAGVETHDRAWIQTQIDAVATGGEIHLPAGRYLLEKAPIGSYNRFAALSTHGKHVTIRGDGPATVLELHGSQAHQSVMMISVDPSAEHVLIADMTLRCRADSDDPCIDTDEQTHAVGTSGVCAKEIGTCRPIRDLELRNIWCDWPRDTADRKGDCVRLLGNTAPAPATDTTPEVLDTQLYGVSVTDCHLDAARSAIEIQRGVYDARVTDNTLNSVKTCLDGEATGSGHDGRLVVSHNTFLPGCSPAASLTNTDGASVTDNTMSAGVTIYRSTGVMLSHNVITDVATGDTGTIDVRNVCDGLVVSDNVVTRGGAAGPVFKLAPHSGGVCQHASISGNFVTQMTNGPGVYVESTSYTRVNDNQFVFTSASVQSGVYARSVLTSALTGLIVSDNEFDGSLAYGVQLHASPGTFGAGVSVHGNVATSSKAGLWFNYGPGFTKPVVSYGNSMGACIQNGAQIEPGL